ncbi:chorismate mutase [Chloroflexota bacterium]
MSHEGSHTARCRGIRGATTVESDSAAAILEATRELLAGIVEANGVDAENVASAFFTVTPDLTAAFPARAARDMGWRHVALLDAQEIPVPGSLSRCVRVLVHWNTAKPQAEICHVYQRGAASLRPDLQNNTRIDLKGGEKT